MQWDLAKKSVLVLVVIILALQLTQSYAGEGFYVVASRGGTSGKILKSQLFTSKLYDTTLGTIDWEKLSSVQWTYAKVSATSKLIITYQDSLNYIGNVNGHSAYQIRVNDLPSDAGPGGACLICSTSSGNSFSTTGVWSDIPKDDAILTIWHKHSGATSCVRNYGVWTTTVFVMEVEP
jgi:hypothetical protein